jgi:hypothetical protein
VRKCDADLKILGFILPKTKILLTATVKLPVLNFLLIFATFVQQFLDIICRRLSKLRDAS